MNEYELKKYINSAEVQDNVKQLAKFYQVDINVLKELLDGLINAEIDSSEIAITLEDRLELDFDTALKLTLDLQRKILNKISDELERLKEISPGKNWQNFLPDKLAEDLLSAVPEYEIKSDNIKNRLIEALVSWIKDIRDINELRDYLTKSEKIGGVGMPGEVFDKLQPILMDRRKQMIDNDIDLEKLIDNYENKESKDLSITSEISGEDELEDQEIDVAAKPEIKPKIETELAPKQEDVTIDQLLAEQEAKEQDDYLARKEAIKRELQATETDLASKISETEADLQTRQELSPPPPSLSNQPAQTTIKEEFSDFDFGQPKSVAETQQTEPIQQQPEPQVSQPEIPVTEAQSEQPVQQVPQQGKPIFEQKRNTNRPRVEDVMYSPQLTGPIDELASLTINDLRRLSKDPDEATNKIIAKLDLLEDESLVKRAEGVKALKKSPLYNLYAEIMDRAILEGKSFEQVLAEEEKISLPEFKAIMNLNKVLKY